MGAYKSGLILYNVFYAYSSGYAFCVPQKTRQSGRRKTEVKMRIAVIGIVIEKDRSSAGLVNEILSEYGDFVVGRMGVPDRANNVYVISVIVKATNEVISAITGKLGKIPEVKVKSAVTSCEIQ